MAAPADDQAVALLREAPIRLGLGRDVDRLGHGGLLDPVLLGSLLQREVPEPAVSGVVLLTRQEDRNARHLRLRLRGLPTARRRSLQHDDRRSDDERQDRREDDLPTPHPLPPSSAFL